MGRQIVPLGGQRTGSDECRRYRVVAFNFDTRARLLAEEISDQWEPHIQEQHRDNTRRLREELLFEFGIHNGERKIRDFTELGAAPWSVATAHNPLLQHVRYAFAFGAYYAALLGAAGLGERILNELILTLRDDYAEHGHTRRVSGQTVDDWTDAIEVLGHWGVFDEDLMRDYKRLARLRHDAVHYRGDVDADPRTPALAAITLLQSIIERRFSGHDGPPTYLAVPGEIVLSREAEHDPFTRRFVLPSSALVSPRHELDMGHSGWLVYDDSDYPDTPLSDDEWVAARAAAHGGVD